VPTDAAASGLPIDPAAARSDSHLRIVWVYPDLLSTYGDRGNLLILARRAQARGIDVETIPIAYDEPIPRSGDIYLVGGGEDRPQTLAAQRMRADGGLRAAVSAGAAVLAVCAGIQLIGEYFHIDGNRIAGAELLDLRSDRGDSRAVGELVGEVDPRLGLPLLTGFENHGGRCHLGPAANPLAKVLVGTGNDGETEGAWAGRVIGTYLHGPALSRNPALADLVLAWALDVPLTALPPIDDSWPEKLRAERLAAVLPR
jgi:CobQ-like glutamine amidotransferase family enzyme